MSWWKKIWTGDSSQIADKCIKLCFSKSEKWKKVFKWYCFTSNRLIKKSGISNWWQNADGNQIGRTILESNLGISRKFERA